MKARLTQKIMPLNVFYIIMTMACILELPKMIVKMVMDYIVGKVVLFLKETGLPTKKKALESLFGKVVMLILANGKMVTEKEKQFIYKTMVPTILVYGKMTN